MDLSVLILSLAILLVVASLLQPLAARLGVPYTVLLAGVGVLIGGLSTVLWEPGQSRVGDPTAPVIGSLPLTSEMFMIGFLPLLLFQAAMTIDVRRMADDAAPILLMAIVAVLVSTFVVGIAIWPLSGLSIVACLLLASIVATTDPSAVVGIFRDLGAPARLTRLVEGESLLNDAAAIVLFAIFLDILTTGRQPDLTTAAVTFLVSFVGGAGVGVIGGQVVVKIMPALQGLRSAEVTLTLALPSVVYIVSNSYLGVSGVVAAVTAGLTLSATGRGRISPENWHYLEDIWQQLGFWASSLVFVLAAILVPNLIVDIQFWDLVLLITVVMAALGARAVMVFGFLPLLSVLRLSASVDGAYKMVILWGGLRGAVTVALAIGVTENPFVDPEIQRFVAILATGFVLFTLFVNGTTLRPMIKLLHLDRLSPIDRVMREQVLALSLTSVRDALRQTATHYHIPPNISREVIRPYDERIRAASTGQSVEDRIADRDRITIGLVALANRERELLLDHYRQRHVSSTIVEHQLAHVRNLLDQARSQGRVGYNRAARRMLAYSYRFKLGQFLHQHFQSSRLLVSQLTIRFETQQINRLLLEELRHFARTRLRNLLGDRVGEIIDDVLATRQENVEKALDALRLQYPDYADSLERRYLQKFALRLEELEYKALLDEALIGPELYTHLIREVEGVRNQADRLPQLDLALDTRELVRQFPLFANLNSEQISHIAWNLRTQFTVPNERIIRPGDRSESVYFISSGAVEVIVEDVKQTFRLGRGDFFGELAILSGRPRRSTVLSLGYCHLLILDGYIFRQLLEQHPDIKAEVTRIANVRAEVRATVSSLPKPPVKSGGDR